MTDVEEFEYMKNQNDINLRSMALDNSLRWLLQFTEDQNFDSDDVIVCADKFYHFLKDGQV